MSNTTSKKIAVIGTGISGLAAASLLNPHHQISVYEKNDYIGGHSRTLQINTPDGVVPVDTGFIVFNKRNYPLLTRLFEYLEVPIAKSDMSFGVSINQGWLEYGTRQLCYLFAQKRNWLRPAFWKMLLDILTFNKNAARYLERDPSFTLGACLDEMKLGPWFRDYFLLAMGGAIWSAAPQQMLDFPASSFIRFFDNHGLLTVNDHPQWFTVQGGSRVYVERLAQPFRDKIRVGCGVRKVSRSPNGVVVEDTEGQVETYDDVVFACHADQALSMIADPSEAEARVLSAFAYQPNRAVLHSDASFMPKRQDAWASWVYLAEGQGRDDQAMSLTYWMNNLQPLSTSQPILVTLNPGREPDPALVYNDYTFEHPVFNSEAIKNQPALDGVQGQNRLWFCGAYQRYGFHEDGLGSAVQMVAKMGITPPW